MLIKFQAGKYPAAAVSFPMMERIAALAGLLAVACLLSAAAAALETGKTTVTEGSDAGPTHWGLTRSDIGMIGMAVLASLIIVPFARKPCMDDSRVESC